MWGQARGEAYLHFFTSYWFNKDNLRFLIYKFWPREGLTSINYVLLAHHVGNG